MRGLLLRLVGVLSFGPGLLAAAWAADQPPKQAAPLPPYQRLLRGADARKAQQLRTRIDTAWAAGRFEEVLRSAEALRVLRERGQGLAHWQAANARSLVVAVRRVLKQDAAARRAMAAARAQARTAEAEEARARYPEAQAAWQKILVLHRKVLGEDHPYTAAAYNGLASNLSAQGRYAAAQPLYEKALAIYRNALGEEHPETATAYGNLAGNLFDQGQYAAARPLFEKALAIRRKALGDQDPDTAQAYNNLAANLSAEGDHAAAQLLFEKALVIKRKALGEQAPGTAGAYDSLASNLDVQGKYTAAQRMYEKALAIRRKALGEDHPAVAGSYGNLAGNLDAQGKYAAAQPLYEKALAIRRKLLGEEHPDTAGSYGNLAGNLRGQGRYAASQPLCEKALAITRKVLGEQHPDTAANYSNLAVTLNAQGRYAAAQPLFEKALAIYRKGLGEDHPATATAYENLAADLDAQGQYGAAQPLFEKAVAIRTKVLGAEHPETALSYNSLAGNLNAQHRYAAAQRLFEKALAVCRRTLGEEHPDTANSYSNLAFNLNTQGKYAAAQPLFEKALAIRRRVLGQDHPDTAMTYNNLAYDMYRQGQYAKAETYWTAAAAVFARARLLTAAGGLERTAATAEFSPLPGLTAVLARGGKPEEAWRRFEQSLARGTWDDLSARLRRSPAERDRQTALVQDLHRLDQFIERTLAPKDTPELKARREQLLTQRRQKRDDLAALTEQLEKEHGPAAGQVRDRATIQKALPADAALVGWVDTPARPKAADPNGDHWAVILRARGLPTWQRLPATGPNGAWTEADSRLATELREALQDPSRDWRALARRLHEQRLRPLAGHLAARDGLPAVQRLIVLPAPALAGVPLEVCAKSYTVSYAPSGTLYSYLRGLAKPASRGLLALADPVFEGPRLLAASRGGAEDQWPELPGTRVEAERLGRLCQSAGLPFRLLADSQASEQELDRLARSKELAGYRYIHLATHGALDDRLPLQSAVILSRDRLPDPLKQLEAGQPVYDGRLTAEEVLERWDLHAELVTLSACETALGKYEGGEGFVGFTQALLLSGARSVCLSLWKVDDTATALLMQRFYANLLGQRPGLKAPLGKAEALAEAKTWLRELTVEEAARQAAALTQGVARGKGRKPLPVLAAVKAPGAGKAARPYAHPYYWAAFVLVGDGD